MGLLMPVLPSIVTPPTVTAGRQTAPKVVLRKGPAYANEQTGDRQGNQIQQNTRNATQQAGSNPLAAGNLVKSVSFPNSGAAVTVPHYLNRLPLGFLLTSPTGLTAGSPCATMTAATTSTITLLAVGVFTSDVLVF
jgi:hypothetical protein